MSCYSKYFEFHAGEHKKLEIQINVSRAGCKEPLDLTGSSSIEVDLPTVDGTLTLDLLSAPPVVIDSPVLGKISIELSPTQTNLMIDGVIVVRITIGGKVTIATSAGVRRLVPQGC